MPDPDRIATQLLLIARNPHNGRLRRPRVLDIALRAALLAELVLDGRVTQRNGAPFASGVLDTDDRVLDAVARTVERRPGVAWWRWFRHVRADRAILTTELTEAGRWTPRGGGLRAVYDDADEGATLALSHETTRVAQRQQPAKDARQGVLAVLSVMCGATGARPQPRALRGDLKPVVEAIAASGEVGAEALPALLAGASLLSRRPLRR